MSDTMLFGVLRMPFGAAMSDEISRQQYWQRGQQAASEIERLTRERDEERRAVQLAVEKLVSEIERQSQHIDELKQKIDAEKSCACSYDAPGDVCSWHSPALAKAQAEVERLRVENSRLRALIGEYFREPETHPVERDE